MNKKIKSVLVYLITSLLLTSLLNAQDFIKEDISMIFLERTCSKVTKRVVRLSIWADGETEVKISYPGIQVDSIQIKSLQQNGWIIDSQACELPYSFRKKNIMPINHAKNLFYSLLKEGIAELTPFKPSKIILDGCNTSIGIKSYLLYKELVIVNPDSINDPEIKAIFLSCSDKININQYELMFYREMNDKLD